MWGCEQRGWWDCQLPQAQYRAGSTAIGPGGLSLVYQNSGEAFGEDGAATRHGCEMILTEQQLAAVQALYDQGAG